MVSKVSVQAVALQAKGQGVRPLPLWRSLLWFGIPALGFRLSLYNGLPALIKLGLTPFAAAVVAITVPAAVLFACAFGAIKAEGHTLTRAELAARLRLQRMGGRDWLWTAGGFVLAFLATGALGFTALALIRSVPALEPPAGFPAFLNPLVTSNVVALPAALQTAVGAPLAGNWGVALLLAVALFFNIAGEELWWRGVILPRQELALGRWTWLVHALLWLLFHMPIYPWRLVDLLPYCLIISYIAQRRHNTWPGLIIHCQNAMVLLVVVAQVMGLA
jgi:membrane protease YdiL (CAAX protease family)